MSEKRHDAFLVTSGSRATLVVVDGDTVVVAQTCADAPEGSGVVSVRAAVLAALVKGEGAKLWVRELGGTLEFEAGKPAALHTCG